MSLASIVQYGLSTYTDSSYQRPGNYSVFPYKAEGDGIHDRHVPHRHDFYQLIWLTEGSGHLQCDLKQWRFETGTLFFAAPGRLHCWHPETPARGVALGFTDEFLCAESDRPSVLGRFAYLHESDSPLLTLSGAEQAEMTALFNCLLKEAAQNEPGRDDVVRAYIMIVLAKARRWLTTKAGGAPDARAAKTLTLRFRHALEEHFPRLLKVSDYAALLHTSRTQLNQDLRLHTGQTASEHIHDRILLEAKRLLLYSNATVSEIAYELSFQDPSYFCRFFRQR
ncbi:MAG TPA: AraC family transcriptional regulator, partial [Rariglobus sp.]